MALADRARRDEQLARLQDAIAGYEAEFGEITADEIASVGPAWRLRWRGST
jgi:hypothetical protein